jgi:hypothetical protein
MPGHVSLLVAESRLCSFPYRSALDSNAKPKGMIGPYGLIQSYQGLTVSLKVEKFHLPSFSLVGVLQ